MKNTLVILLAIVFCLSIAACGSNDNTDMPETTASVVPTTVEVESTHEHTEAMTEPEVFVVEITLDNWQDYFEIHPDYYTTTNAFGEVTLYTYDYVFLLKDEYTDKVSNISDLAFKVNAAIEYREVDGDSLQMIEGGHIDGTEVRECIATCRDYRDTTDGNSAVNGRIAAKLGASDGYTGRGTNLYWVFYTGEFDVTAVTGSLELSE